MALIQCPDCGNDVSDQAAACPKCARPLRRHVSTTGKRAILLSVAGLLLFGCGVMVGVLGIPRKGPVNPPPANRAEAATDKSSVPAAPQMTVGTNPGQLRDDDASRPSLYGYRRASSRWAARPLSQCVMTTKTR